MLSMTLEQGLILSNCALLVFSVFSGFLFYRQSKKNVDAVQYQLNNAQSEYAALAKSSLGVGRRLKKLEQKVTQDFTSNRSAPEEAIYQQAQKLVDMGASADDLVASCGVARAEAELLVSLQRQQTH